MTFACARPAAANGASHPIRIWTTYSIWMLDELDEDEMKRSFFENASKDIPREILPVLFEVAKESFFRGEDPTEILSQILLEDAPTRKNPPGRKKKKGRRW